jgi:hypothetical protein
MSNLYHSQGHWLWRGARQETPNGYSRGGYAIITLEGRRCTVHRAIFQLTRNAYPEALAGKELMHIAQCPFKHCCNPSHLVPGTHAENMAMTRGQTHPGHGTKRKLTNAQVRTIRSRHKRGTLLTRAMARKLHVDPRCIRRVVLRLTYANVD